MAKIDWRDGTSPRLTRAEKEYLDTITVDVNLDGHCIWTVELKLSELEPGGKVKINIPIDYGRRKK